MSNSEEDIGNFPDEGSEEGQEDLWGYGEDEGSIEEISGDYGSDGSAPSSPQILPGMGTFGPGGRIGMPGTNLATIMGGGGAGAQNLRDIQNRMKIVNDPEERFKQIVDGLSRHLEDQFRSANNRLLEISEADIEHMLKKIPDISRVEHKNPLGYIIGYMASSGGTDMNSPEAKQKINSIFVQLPYILDGEFQKPDVIRYARYWMNLSEK